MNTHEKTPLASASNLREPTSYSTDSQVAALEAVADNGISYLFPYAQFLYAERIANPTLQTDTAAPPERLTLHFAQAEIVLHGSGLALLAKPLQKYELQSVRPLDRRLAAPPRAHIASVIVSLTKTNV